MSSFRLRPAAPADAAAVAEILRETERRLYGTDLFTEADQREMWRNVDLERDTRVAVADDGRVIGYGFVDERGELLRAQATVHPDAVAQGVGTSIAAALEREAATRGARRVQTGVYHLDAAAHRLFDALGYVRVREFREMRIELGEPPAPPEWPEGLHARGFDAERDARAFHAAQEEAFADHWEHRPRAFERWYEGHVEYDGFDPSLWCVVRSGDEIVAGAINVAGLFGGGWVSVVFTRRPWRGRGVGRGLLQDAFTKFWERGERSVGLGVDAESETGAFRLYERAGMKPTLGWSMYEKTLA